MLSLHDDSVGLIPLLTTHSLHQLVGDMRKHGVSGFCTRQWMISDHDLSVAYLSKASWYPDATPKSVYVDQIRSVCGESSVEPLLEAFRELEAVTVELEDHGMGLAKLDEAMRLAQVAEKMAVRAIESFAGVAKNRADAGAIATMAEFVYRPLKRKVKELQVECSQWTAATEELGPP